jgi:hypothetical protein
MSNTMQSGGWPEWQPIETAPKDGTEIIIREGGRTFTAVYGGGYFRAEGWFSPGDRIANPWDAFHPTDWMPLPPAPEVGK